MNKLISQIKGAWKSWTIWWNATGVAILAMAMVEPTVLQYLTDKELTTVILLGNVILRFKTSSDLKDKG